MDFSIFEETVDANVYVSLATKHELDHINSLNSKHNTSYIQLYIHKDYNAAFVTSRIMVNMSTT